MTSTSARSLSLNSFRSVTRDLDLDTVDMVVQEVPEVPVQVRFVRRRRARGTKGLLPPGGKPF